MSVCFVLLRYVVLQLRFRTVRVRAMLWYLMMYKANLKVGFDGSCPSQQGRMRIEFLWHTIP